MGRRRPSAAGDAGDAVGQVLGGQGERRRPLVSSSVCLGRGQHLLGRRRRRPPAAVVVAACSAAGDQGQRARRRAAEPQAAAGASVMGSASHTGQAPREPRRRPGPAQAAIGWLPGVPGAVAPAGRPRAGRPARRWPRRPAPARRRPTRSTSVSSPLRNRWQRTPPVARPLAGYSANGVTLTAPGSVPGRAVDEPDDGDHDRRRRRVDARRTRPTRCAGGRAGCRPCRRRSGPAAAPPAPEVQQLGVGGDEARASRRRWRSSTAPTTSSPSLSRDDLPLVAVAEDLGVDPLDDALRGCRARGRGRRRRSGVSASARSPGSSDRTSLTGAPPGRLRVVGRWRAASGRSSTPSRTTRPRDGDQRRPRRGRWCGTAETIDVVLGAAAARRRAARRVGGAGQQPGGGQQHEARVVGDLERRGGRGDGACRPTPAARCGAACRRSWRPRPARRRRPSRSSVSSARIASSSSISRSQLVLLLLQLDPGEPGQPAQRHVEDVVGLRPRSGRRPRSAAPWPPRRRREARISWMTSSMSRIATSRPVDQVQPVGRLAAAERRAPAYDVEAVAEEDLEQLLEARACAAGRRPGRRC